MLIWKRGRELPGCPYEFCAMFMDTSGVFVCWLKHLLGGLEFGAGWAGQEQTPQKSYSYCFTAVATLWHFAAFLQSHFASHVCCFIVDLAAFLWTGFQLLVCFSGRPGCCKMLRAVCHAKKPLTHSMASSPKAMESWGCLPHCKTGYRAAKRAEMPGNRQVGGVEGEEVP